MIHWGYPLAKVGSSAKFCVLVFKASMLYSLGCPSAKVGSSANFGVLVFKASLLFYLGVGVPSAKFGVVVFKVLGVHQSICQVWCRGIQGIYS